MNSVSLFSLLDPETAKQIAAGVRSGKTQFEATANSSMKKKATKALIKPSAIKKKAKPAPMVSSVFNWGAYLLKKKKPA
jgi:hypothetical protein